MHPKFKPQPFIEAEGLLESDTTPFCLQHYTETYIVSTLLDYLVSESLTATPLGQIRLENKEQLNGTRQMVILTPSARIRTNRAMQ